MHENKDDSHDAKDFKKQNKVDTKINHYTWTDIETEKVKEGKNKGWKEHKIKNHYFSETKNPTKHHIKTLLKKLPKKRKKDNERNSSSSHNTNKLSHLENESIRKLSTFGAKYNTIGFECYYTHYFEKKLYLMVSELPGHVIADLQISEYNISFTVKINGPPILEFCKKYNVPIDNDNLERASKDFRSKFYKIEIAPKFKLSLQRDRIYNFSKTILEELTYFIVEIDCTTEYIEITNNDRSSSEDFTDSEN